MTEERKIVPRLEFLVRVVSKECQHLATTDRRLFGGVFTIEQVTRLEADHDLAERVEAFVGRFGRLQDTVGDKLLPLLLDALGEKTSAILISALQTGHAFVPTLIIAADKMIAEIKQRGWA